MSACTIPLVSPLKRTTNALVLALIALVAAISVVPAAFGALERTAKSVVPPMTYGYESTSSWYDHAANLAPDIVDDGRSGVRRSWSPVGASGQSRASAEVISAPRAPGLVDEAATVGRSASTEWGRVVQNFQQHGDEWTRFSAHVEQATGRAYRGGTSIEEIFRRGDDWLVRHRIYGPGGDVLHETFRPYAKFGQ